MANTLPPIGVPYSVVDPASTGSFNTILQQLLGQLTGGGAPKPPDYGALLGQAVNSPLMQEVLGPALQNLLPGEDLARTSLMDEFRSSGALGSGAMGAASAKLENALQGQRANLVSQVMSSMLPTMTQGLSNQFNQQMAIPGLLSQILGLTRPIPVRGENPPGGAGTQPVDDPFGFLTTPSGGSYAGGSYAAGGMGGAGGGGGVAGGGGGAKAGAPYPVGESGGMTYMSDGTAVPDLSYYAAGGWDYSNPPGTPPNPNIGIDPSMYTGSSNIGLSPGGIYTQYGGNPANINPWDPASFGAPGAPQVTFEDPSGYY